MLILSSCAIRNPTNLYFIESFENTINKEKFDYLEIKVIGDTLLYFRPEYVEYFYDYIDDTSNIIDYNQIIFIDDQMWQIDSAFHDKVLEAKLIWKVNYSKDTITYEVSYHESAVLTPTNFLILNKKAMSNVSYFPARQIRADYTHYKYPEKTIKCFYRGTKRIQGHKTFCFEFQNFYKYDSTNWIHKLYLDSKTLLPFAFDIQYFISQIDDDGERVEQLQKTIRRKKW